MSPNFTDLHDLLVEWVYDHRDPRTGSVDIKPFGEEHGLDLNGSFALLAHSVDQGMLDDKARAMGAPVANLTSRGTQWVEERRQHRMDPRLRAAAARKGLLNWLWSQKTSAIPFAAIDSFLDANESLFEGERLRDDEIASAAEYLEKKGLIHGAHVEERRGPVHAETTPAGDDCVEHYGGDVSAYERRHDQASGPVFNIHGGNVGNIAANSRDFEMNATTTSTDADWAQFVMFARALRQAAPVLGLSEAEIEELAQTADWMEQEASGESPDVGRLQRWRRNTVDLLNSAMVSGALGSILAAYGQAVLPGLPHGS